MDTYLPAVRTVPTMPLILQHFFLYTFPQPPGMKWPSDLYAAVTG